MAVDVFTSPYYEYLEAALARHEAALHLTVTALNALVSGDGQSDPTAQLAKMPDQATSQLSPGKNRRRQVVGLTTTPTEPIPHHMQHELDERQALIEARARQPARGAQDAGAKWVAHLSKPPAEARARERWQSGAATVALYRHRYEISTLSPLGDTNSIRNPEQAAEYRLAQAAQAQARRLIMSSSNASRRQRLTHTGQRRRV